MSLQMKSLITGSLLLFGSCSGAGWDYDHMDEWAHHFGFCGTNDQSPIDIMADRVLYDEDYCQPALNWSVDWTVHDWMVKNNGHSIALVALEKIKSSDTETVPDITDDYNNRYKTRPEPIARLPNYFKPEGSDITEFCLDSFHFHWGLEDVEGSEHVLDGVSYPLEIHFVHYACDRGSAGAAVGAYPNTSVLYEAKERGEDVHELAVVGIFFEISEFDNPAFDSMLSEDTLEQVQLPEGGWNVINRLYLQDIIPPEVMTDGYYSYEGSLTTPPCTNIVRWHVSNTKSYISKTQIGRFRELLATPNQTSAPNFRVPQYNVNPVYACMEEPAEKTDRSPTVTAVVWLWAVVVCIMMCCLMGICYYRSLRDARINAVHLDNAQNRKRLQSKSSIDNGALRPAQSFDTHSTMAPQKSGSVHGH